MAGTGELVPVQSCRLPQLMHDTAEPVYLVVDGHPTPRSKLVKEFVASTDGRCARSYYPLTPPTLGPHPPAVSGRSGRSTPVLAVPTPGPGDGIRPTEDRSQRQPSEDQD